MSERAAERRNRDRDQDRDRRADGPTDANRRAETLGPERRREGERPDPVDEAIDPSPTTGILLFDDVEELDFAGPWEVLTATALVAHHGCVCTIAEREGPIHCAKGLRVLPDFTFENAPALDVLVVPGGRGTRREVSNPVLMEWLRKVGPQCRWLSSVCTGVLLLHEAGFARHRRVTTHWAFTKTLRERGEVTVLDDRRYVRDENLVTAAGVSAGIDMTLWLVGQLYSQDTARAVRQYIQYDPSPPYAAEV